MRLRLGTLLPVLVLLVAVPFVMDGIGRDERGSGSGSGSGSGGGVSAGAGVVSAARATRLLADLTTGPRVASYELGYDRDAFGEAWKDTDGNGCNQRDDVLLRDAVPGSTTTAQQGACDHDVLAGRWVDPYTGKRLAFTDLKDPAQAQAIQIDHVVPLAEAWVSGASSWSDARRERYANDLGVLLASDGPTNAAKSDDDPAAWRPRAAYQCTYARRWVAVKSEYDLTVDASERAALTSMLDAC
ncbi:HNH endonuclease family protein [Nocardioides sp. GY 10127]|uniref:HNH endonuclease family protein n=1 Tax=Nocardioides sp. GY 10127 TaxID=2569762 RepID=UPI0010A8DB0F|nr:HNH endonuclease family protein [Nocardioides sp. GY 10127]TIC81693.1 HNH endonuclease [Nocardioides sp. GY 10127]